MAGTLRGDWHRSAVCAQVDPELWSLKKGLRPSRHAIEICGRCPVRIECRDDHLANGDLNGGVIAGGWIFYGHAETPPLPYPGDPPAPARARRAPTRTYHIDPVIGRRFIAAGRALLDEIPIGDVCHRYGLAPSSVRAAGTFLRHASPTTVRAVEQGEIGIKAGMAQVRRAGQLAGSRP